MTADLANDAANGRIDHDLDDDDGEHLDGLRRAGLPVVDRRPPAATVSVRVLDSAVAELVDRSWADSTRSSYEGSWLRFCAWCYATGAPDPLAVDEHDIARWVAAQVAAGTSAAYLDRQLAAITHAFDLAGRISPTKHVLVRRTVAGARRSLGTAQRRAIPLRLDELRRILTALAIVTGRPRTDPLIRRDRALLGIGWAAALRRSELVALDVEHLTFIGTPDQPSPDGTSGGVLIHVPHAKTDQQSAGADIAVPYSHHPATCPVRTLMTLARIQRTGPLFRTLDRHRPGRRLAAGTVNTIVKTYVATVLQRDPSDYTAHSLRAGFVTELRARNQPAHKIMRQTRHRDLRMLDVYDRPTDLLNDPTLAGEWW